MTGPPTAPPPTAAERDAVAWVEVAVALPVPGTYHYRARAHQRATLAVGSRVLVPFGARAVSGVVVRTGAPPATDVARILDITDVLDPEPAVSTELVALCLWIAEYYVAPPGEVLRAALPAGTQIVAEAVCALTEAGRAHLDGQGGALPGKQRDLLARLATRPVPRARLGRDRGELDRLIAAGLVELAEARSKARVKTRTERWACLVAQVTDDVALAAARAALARAPKRLAVLDAVIAAGGALAVADLADAVPAAAAALRELATAGLLTVETRAVDPGVAAAGVGLPGAVAPPQLNPAQRARARRDRRRAGRARRTVHRLRRVPAPRRHRQRQDRGLPARHRARARRRRHRAGAGPRDLADAAAGRALPRPLRRSGRDPPLRPHRSRSAG